LVGADPQQEVLRLNTLSGKVEVLSEPIPLWHASSGFQVWQDRVQSESAYIPTGGNGAGLIPMRLPDGGRSRQLALYSLHSFDLLKLRLTLGGRLQADQRRGMTPQGRNATWRSLRLGGHVGGMYPISDHYFLSSSLRTGYRAPSLFELAGFGPIDAGVSVPNDSLMGERIVTSEIGIKARTDLFSGRLMLYRTRLDNSINYQPSTWQGTSLFLDQQVYRPTHVGESVVQGVEASMEVPVISALSVYGSLVYAYGAQVNQAQPRDGIPPINSRLGLYYQNRWGLWSRLEWRHAGSQQLLSPLDRRDPAIGNEGVAAWDVVDLRVGYDFKWGYATIGMLNLLDERYRYLGSDVPGLGRRLVLSVQLGF